MQGFFLLLEYCNGPNNTKDCHFEFFLNSSSDDFDVLYSRFRLRESFLGFKNKMEFDVLQTYFDINVKMACIKNDTLDYLFRFRPRGSSSATTNNGEGRLSGSGPADGAIDKKNVLSVLLPNADDITKEKYGKSKTILEALNFLVASKKYKGLQTWVNKGKYKFLNIKNLDKKADDKLIRRGLLNLNYAYLIDTYKDQKELYKKFYLAAKKVNEFSSIHYKISG